MALGDALQKRMEELAKRQSMIDRRLAAIAEGATLRAVEEAQDHTPTNTYREGELRGTHTIAAGMAQHWSTDSRTVPVHAGNTYTTTLANNQKYASYVNDGHHLDRHFVPGLYIDENGLLSRNLDGSGGMVVGTVTRYVSGLYMKEAGVDKYRDVLEKELRALTEETFR